MLRVKRGEGGHGHQQMLPMCCCGIQNCYHYHSNSEAETPSGMPRAELSPADKICNSSATSTLCTDCAGTSPMHHRTSVLPRSLGWGWATDPSCGEQLCCVPGGGGGGSPVMVLPVPPTPPLYNEL